MDNEPETRRSQPVVVVLGATATGKTGLAIRLAHAFNGEVVSADSRYLYRGMDIGTAKPTLAERQDVPHHLIDIRNPTEPYALATFLSDAGAAIEAIASRGRLPIVAGGTPQYLRALLEGWRVPEVEPDPEFRAALEQEATAVLFDRLVSVDPASAERVGPTNKRRVIRALEVHAKTGRTMSELTRKTPPPWRFHVIGLFQDRESLYRRIDERVRAMFASGWIDEARALREAGVTAATPAMSAHGYREALEVALGDATVEEAIARASFMIHRYVRHQETWFRRFEGVRWIDSSRPGFEEEAISSTRLFLDDGSSSLQDAPGEPVVRLDGDP